MVGDLRCHHDVDDEHRQDGEVLNAAIRLPEERYHAEPDEVENPVADGSRTYPCLRLGFVAVVGRKEALLEKSVLGPARHNGEPPQDDYRLREGRLEGENDGARYRGEEDRHPAIGAHDGPVEFETNGRSTFVSGSVPAVRSDRARMDARTGHLDGVSSPRMDASPLPSSRHEGKVSLNA